MRLHQRILLALAMATLALPLLLSAQDSHARSDYPDQPIHLIIPYPAGGGTDVIGRAVGDHISKELDVPVVVENKPGASGIIGNNIVAKAKPDGHTLLLGITALIQAPLLYDEVPYKVEDLASISQIALSADFFVVHKDVPADTLDEFIQLVKNDPGKYNYGNYGNGTSSHMHGELLKLNNDLDLVAVPFQGAAPLVNAILGGQITAAFVDASSAHAHLDSERFKVLAITGKERHPAKPEVKTMEAEVHPAIRAYGWVAVSGTKMMHLMMIEQLSQLVQEGVDTAEYCDRGTIMSLKRDVGGPPGIAE